MALTQVSGSNVPFHPLLLRARSDNDDVLGLCPREEYLLGLCVESRRDLIQRFVQGSPGQARDGDERAVTLANYPVLVAELDQRQLLVEVVRVNHYLHGPHLTSQCQSILSQWGGHAWFAAGSTLAELTRIWRSGISKLLTPILLVSPWALSFSMTAQAVGMSGWA